MSVPVHPARRPDPPRGRRRGLTLCQLTRIVTALTGLVVAIAELVAVLR
ncbi:hypothetical protein [Longispora urticae]